MTVSTQPGPLPTPDLTIRKMALDTNKISIATHIDTPQTDRVMSLSDEKTATLQAKAASDDEHSMTLLEGLKSHPKAVMWSMLLSTTIIMEGYDIVLVGRCPALT